MALRTTCLYNGKTIGIESIFTVVDGMQINIPEKVEALRAKSRNNELFCPCGCGANLTLVAGDRNLREQHFRLKDSHKEKDCDYISEGIVSASSKIILKCWLEDKLGGALIESRVPISAIDDISRKYEMTLLSRERKIAISYCHDRTNLSDEKLSILESNSAGIQLHYITDIENTGNDMQYPEMMMKTQKRQGYCLYLHIAFDERMQARYSEAELSVSFFYHNPNGYWQEVPVVSDKLSSFSFASDGLLMYVNASVHSLKKKKEAEFLEELEIRRRNWEKQQTAIKAAAEKKRAEEAKRQAEQKALQEQMAEQARLNREKQERLRREAEEKKASEIAALELAKKEFSKEKIDAIIDDDQEHPFRDPLGNRWVRCEYCGKVATDDEFGSYGGMHHANLGMCKACGKEQRREVLPKYQKNAARITDVLEKTRSMPICPKCGGQLKERNGRFGPFWGCSNYPTCRYTESKL